MGVHLTQVTLLADPPPCLRGFLVCPIPKCGAPPKVALPLSWWLPAVPLVVVSNQPTKSFSGGSEDSPVAFAPKSCRLFFCFTLAPHGHPLTFGSMLQLCAPCCCAALCVRFVLFCSLGWFHPFCLPCGFYVGLRRFDGIFLQERNFVSALRSW